MRMLALTLTLCLIAPLSSTAAPEDSPLSASADREARRVALSFAKGASSSPDMTHSGWISRHPALFGMLVGAGAGAATSLMMENELFCSGGDEDCLFYGGNRALVGAGIGAGVGALVGWIVGDTRVHRDLRSRDRGITPDARRFSDAPIPR